MQLISILALASAALAAPAAVVVPVPVPAPVITREDLTPNPEFVARQILPSTEEGLVRGGSCGDVVLIFARGSTEIGNMGTIVGPGLGRALDRRLVGRDLTIQGVNYAAALAPNYLPGGTDAASEAEMKKMLRLAHTKCPNADIVVSGYRYKPLPFETINITLTFAPTARAQPLFTVVLRTLRTRSRPRSRPLFASAIPSTAGMGNRSRTSPAKTTRSSAEVWSVTLSAMVTWLGLFSLLTLAMDRMRMMRPLSWLPSYKELSLWLLQLEDS